MKALAVVGGLVAVGAFGAIAYAAINKGGKPTKLDAPVAFPPDALKDAPSLGDGHVSTQVDGHGQRWVVAVFPDTGNPDTVVTIAALESPAGPWIRFVQNNKANTRTLQKVQTAGQPVDPNAMKAAWGVA